MGYASTYFALFLDVLGVAVLLWGVSTCHPAPYQPAWPLLNYLTEWELLASRAKTALVASAGSSWHIKCGITSYMSVSMQISWYELTCIYDVLSFAH